MADTSKTIKFHHGPAANVDAQIEAGTIDGSDIVITSDTDDIIFVDAEKTPHTLGNAKSKNEYTVNLGGGTVGSLKDGDVLSVGTTLDDLIKKLTQKSVPATYTAPGVTCKVATGSTVAGNYEVGTEITTSIQGVFTQNDAGALTSIEILKGGTSVLSQSTSPITSDQTFVLGDETVSFTAKATYAAGAVKNDNLGNPSPEGAIEAGTKTSSAVNFVGKRNAFYGTGVGSIPEVTSAMVRGLTGKKLAPAQGNVLTINVAVGQQYIVFAYPATLRDVNQVKYVETNDTGMAANFDKTLISVEGANGATGADYKVYTYGMATPAAAPMTFEVTI